MGLSPTSFPSKKVSFSTMEPAISETSSVHPETYPRKVNSSNFITPRKVLSEKNIVTPSSPQPSVTHHKKNNPNLAFTIASDLA